LQPVGIKSNNFIRKVQSYDQEKIIILVISLTLLTGTGIATFKVYRTTFKIHTSIEDLHKYDANIVKKEEILCF